MPKKKEVLITLGDVPRFDEEAKNILESVAQVQEIMGAATEEDLTRRARDSSAIILGAPFVSRKVIESASRLEVIARFGTGIENIDLKAATETGVIVTNLPGIYSDAVSEHAILLMLAVARSIVAADKSARKGLWKEFAKKLHTELSGKTIGIIGLGNIGCSIATKAKAAFNMKVLAYRNPHIKYERATKVGAELVSLEELLRTSDVVSLSVPLTTETIGMIGEREIEMMKETSILINTSRGQVVDEAALCRALEERKIAGAGLDVLMEEPPAEDSPLLELDNVVLTPHCAAHTRESIKMVALACADAVISVLQGKLPGPPTRLVNPEVIENRKG